MLFFSPTLLYLQPKLLDFYFHVTHTVIVTLNYWVIYKVQKALG